MAEPILSVYYWRRRLEQAQASGELHQSVFRCPLERWQRIEAKHREILAATIGPAESVLDAGCGYGRLLDLMPDDWQGDYVGVDLSPDFIAEASRLHPGKSFVVADLRRIQRTMSWDRFGEAVPEAIKFDWAVLISVRPMVRRNCGDEVWQQMEAELRRVARRLLFLEYDPDDPGSVE